MQPSVNEESCLRDLAKSNSRTKFDKMCFRNRNPFVPSSHYLRKQRHNLPTCENIWQGSCSPCEGVV